MDPEHTPPPPPRTSSNNPAAATVGPFAASSSTRSPTSSAMLLGMSSPAHSRRRRASPSLYPPLAPGRIASGPGSSSGSPSSRFRQEITAPPPRAPRGGGRQRSTHVAPPSTMLSELAAIRRVGANLEARAASIQRGAVRAAAATLHGGRPMRNTPPWSSMYARSRFETPPPSGSFSGVAPPVSRQLQSPPSTGTLPPQPSRNLSFPGFATSASQQAQPSSSSGVPPPPGGILFGAFSSPAEMQQQQAKSSFTDLAPLPGGSGIFSGFPTSASQQAQPLSSDVVPPPGGILSGSFSSPAMQQQQAKSSFTDLAPLPGSSGIFSGFASPASQQPEATSSFSDLDATLPAVHGGQPMQQAWPSFPTISCVGAPPPTGSFPGFAPPASQQLQPSSSGVPLLPGGTFSGFTSPAMQQPLANSSFTDLPPPLPSGSGTFSDLPSGSAIAPAASQQLQAKSSFTSLAPLPGGGFSGLTPGHGETAMFGSSSWPSSAQLAAPASDTMYGHGQPSSDSESELPPFPPSLQIQTDDVMQFQQPSGNGASTFSEPEAARMHRPPVIQVKKEPVDIDTPCLVEPELITVDDNDDDDDDDDDEVSALLRSFQSPNEPASLYDEPTSTEDMLQHGGGGGSSSGQSALGAVVEGSGQSWKAMLTPSDKVTADASIPWNCHGMSMSQQQIPQQGDVFSTGVSDVAPHCLPSENNVMSGFGQLQQNLQMPMMLSSTELLQLIRRPGPNIWSTPDSSGQGAAGMPAASSASMFDQMSIGGGTMSVSQAGCPETAAAAAAGQYGMFDNSGSSSSTWAAVPDEMASKFEQMSIGDEGSLSIGQGWPATPAPPMFHITGSSSSNAWASMPWNNSSSWTMENSTPGPKLRLGGMEKPRLTQRPPSVAAGASHSMSQRGAHGDLFSVAEIEMIIKDKRLKVMVNTDPRRVKRILNNRASVSKLRGQRHAA